MSSGQQIANSVKDVAVATDKVAENGNLGIKGWVLTNIVQMTAATIVAGSMIYMGHLVLDEWKTQSAAMRDQGKEDRIMFRDTVKELQRSQEMRDEKTGAKIERAVESMESTARSNVELARELKDVVRMVGKTGSPKGPGG